MEGETTQDKAKTPKVAAGSPKKKPARKAGRKATSKRKMKRTPAIASKAKAARSVPSRPERKAPRRRTTVAQRARILAAANRDGLTAKQVQKRFGVKPVTYYSWRKNTMVTKRRAFRQVVRSQATAIGLAGVVRASVKERLRAMLPEIVRNEVGAYLEGVFGKGR